MNEKCQRVLILLIIIANGVQGFPQTAENLVKYWNYRDRLKYFVVTGDKYGESQIICVRNRVYAEGDVDNSESEAADFGQHGVHTGYYLGVLATEYYLLNKNGQYFRCCHYRG